jgi:hypothetical protein
MSDLAIRQADDRRMRRKAPPMALHAEPVHPSAADNTHSANEYAIRQINPRVTADPIPIPGLVSHESEQLWGLLYDDWPDNPVRLVDETTYISQ